MGLDIVRLGTVRALAGHAEEAHRVLEELRQLAERSMCQPPSSQGCMLNSARSHAAFEWAGKAFEHRDPNLLSVKVDPTFDSLRSDPRYQALLQKMNLARER